MTSVEPYWPHGPGRCAQCGAELARTRQACIGKSKKGVQRHMAAWYCSEECRDAGDVAEGLADGLPPIDRRTRCSECDRIVHSAKIAVLVAEPGARSHKTDPPVCTDCAPGLGMVEIGESGKWRRL